ncbi:MAG: UDP-N-acetyl-D-mannosamine dehydrogenase [Puniceicoccales bacterium]|jgi:UDP-N-acetyl-D-mannosaminuronic acid dehydrogenase|nr:UDP-N-acetyl-D-mannosamine dehydrogenase [Puniceicoccales bacterium]
MNYEICVLGLGYIGLPTCSIFATKGKKVLGVDVVPSVVETINEGRIHIEEPELDMLVRAAVQSGNLRAAVKPQPASTFIIAVPTPFTVAENNRKLPDLSFVEAAARSLAEVVEPDNLIVLESTSPVGTTERVRDWLGDALKKLGRPFSADALLYAHCPERILPGQMLKELVSNDRIAGGLTPEASARAKSLYQSFCAAEIFITDARTAEMAKLTENAFRDVNIAFANELSLICERIGVDVWELIRLANRHPRVKILQPGPGVGGHCIAVDPWFIVDAAPEEARVIRTAREVNDSKPHHVVAKVKAAAARLGRKTVVACLGLAFKADVDDLRESPAVEITAELADDSTLRVLAVEPHVRVLPKQLASTGKNVELVSLETALAQADVFLLLVDHKVFRALPPETFTGKHLIDTRGIFKK